MKNGSKILSVVCLLGLSISMSGCLLTESENNIGGHLYVKRNFAILDKDGKTSTVEAGKDYDTVLHMAAQGSLLAVHPNAFTSIDALFPEPAADRLGKFSVAASASKQAFDMTGAIDQRSNSYPETGSESCLLGYNTRVVCREVVTGGSERGHGHNHGHRRECFTETYPVYGQQYYRGIRHTTDRLASLELTDPTSKEVLATFSGSYRMENYLTDKFMTSPCM